MMVDWDRVEQLRAKGWDWDQIADDEKVAFHPDASVHDAGRALRGLYHRQRSREGRTHDSGPRTSKKSSSVPEHIWTLPRIGYLATPILGIWGLLAYLAPSPVGILIGAIPWLAIGFAVAAFVLAFGLLRTTAKRWTPLFRTTLISGIVVGLLVAGLVGLTGYLLFGCPYLPPSSALTSVAGGAGWTHVPVGPWQQDGQPVLFFYGASWCPFCSASSWTIYKALSDFGTVSGAGSALGFSSLADTDAGTPEIILAKVGYSSSTINFVVDEDTSGVDGTFPGTSNCYEQAYVGAYSGSAIPFVVINGQYMHALTPIIQPTELGQYTDGNTGGTGAQTVLGQVNAENGSAWSVVQSQAWWIMAFLTKATGESVSTLAAEYKWSAATQSAVTGYLAQIG